MLKYCIILAAGLGTRMRPLTNDIPKPMVRILDKPLIGYVLDMCFASGIEQVIMNYHYKPASLLDYVATNYPNRVTFSDEQDQLLDSGGGVLKAMQYVDAPEFFVINADCIWDTGAISALTQLYNSYDSDRFDIFKLLAQPKNAIGFDGKPIYALNNKGHVLKNSASLEYEYTGIQIIKQSLFAEYHVEPFSIRPIWDSAFQHNKIGGVDFQGQWLHIGTPEAVQSAEAYLRQAHS